MSYAVCRTSSHSSMMSFIMRCEFSCFQFVFSRERTPRTRRKTSTHLVCSFCSLRPFAAKNLLRQPLLPVLGECIHVFLRDRDERAHVMDHGRGFFQVDFVDEIDRKS